MRQWLNVRFGPRSLSRQQATYDGFRRTSARLAVRLQGGTFGSTMLVRDFSGWNGPVPRAMGEVNLLFRKWFRLAGNHFRQMAAPSRLKRHDGGNTDGAL
jgi:hypothetical protein